MKHSKESEESKNLIPQTVQITGSEEKESIVNQTSRENTKANI